jgi:integrase
MPRPSKGPQLKFDEERQEWVIRDGQLKRRLGLARSDSEKADDALYQYKLEKRDPAKAIREGGPNQAKIADILNLEMKRIAASPTTSQHRKNELTVVLLNMGRWFGHRVVGDLNGDLQERYAAERMRYVMKLVNGERVAVKTDEHAPVAAYRDLKLLAAAVNRFFKKKVGGVQTRFSPVLPEAPKERVRWLTRDEAAKLIWTAWRARKATKLPGSRGRHTSRHIARYILVGIYTGSRNGDICNAAVIPTIGRGYVDLDRGIFKRKPDNKVATSKLQPTVPLPPRLLAHMRRWKRLGISSHSVIEFNGKPITRVRDGWETMVDLAGFWTDDKDQKILRHTLRHTAISWYLQPDRRTGKSIDIEIVSQYCGVSVATIRRVYRHVMPGTFGPLLAASSHFGR